MQWFCWIIKCLRGNRNLGSSCFSGNSISFEFCKLCFPFSTAFYHHLSQVILAALSEMGLTQNFWRNRISSIMVVMLRQHVAHLSPPLPPVQSKFNWRNGYTCPNPAVATSIGYQFLSWT